MSRRAPLLVAGAVAVLFAATIPLSFVAGTNGADTVVFVVPIVPAIALYLWIGSTIASRTGNPIGWIFLSVASFFTIGSFAGTYATLALIRHPGTLPLGGVAAWIDRWALVASLTPLILVFLLFPSGEVPSPRWRWLLRTLVTLMVIEIVAFAVTPGRLTGAMADLTPVHVTNPLGIEALRDVITPLTFGVGLALLLGALISPVALLIRYRRGGTEERQQIRWLAYVGGAAAAAIVLGFATDPRDSGPESLLTAINNAVFFTVFVLVALGTPVASGIAILKYRLYDLDIVVRKTLVATVLLVLIAGVTTLSVVVVGQAALSRGSGRGAGLAVGIAVGALIAPMLRLARRIADRIVYGRRATPYEVLTDFSHRMADAYSTDEVLPRAASIVAAGTGAERVAIWLLLDGVLRPAATWPAIGDGGETTAGGDRFEVRHQGELLGAIDVAMPASDPINGAKLRVLRDLTSQAGLVLRNVRLIEELRASRQRLVAAQDEERRKLERNLHDGAQQQLVALAVQLRLAEQMAGRDPDKEREILRRLQAATNEALDDLRDLARGIYPPLLADKGLAAALEAQGRRSPVPVTVVADGVGRYSQDIEAALYFCSLEALNNIAKYAEATEASIRIAGAGGEIWVEIADDGVGFDPDPVRAGTGLRGMADRLNAIGGRLDLRSSPGHGTVVTAVVPTRTAAAADVQPDAGSFPEPVAAAQADSSRSGPNTALGM
jgi:signal transduction histidine kinase